MEKKDVVRMEVDLSAAVQKMIEATQAFLIQLCAAHCAREPALGERFMHLLSEGGALLGVRVDFDDKTHIEAGITHQGEWLPIARWPATLSDIPMPSGAVN